jgi:hypothetical protein
MSSFANILSKTAELNAQIEKLKAEAAEQVKPLLQQFIVENPQVEAVRWRQYTPYFNDGDECVFNVHDPEFKFVDGAEDAGHNEDGFYDGYWVSKDRGRWSPPVEVCSNATVDACRELAEHLARAEDVLQTLFGDHVAVTVTKDGVDVEEYEHD